MASISRANIKRLYLVGSLLVLAMVIYQVMREEALLQPEHRMQVMLGEHLPLLPSANELEIVSTSVTAAKPVAKPATVSSGTKPVLSDASGPSTNAPDAWRVADASTPTPSLPVPDSVSIYEPVSLDMDNPRYPEVGEQLSMTLPGGERLQVNVESSNSNPNGDYSWRGHLDGYGDEYPVAMTYGGNSVFATVTTPRGSYTLESVAGSGWIYKNPSEAELSNPGSNDYLEIPHTH